ncbi:KH domain-containing, RNA-binding, signal transduction-associated protein 3 [Trichonephila clavata]|uniref:KH domain-containing, RNA-binding, signal transduction-associated protein 3 n=1 Tax=Trichonephila clavata TaxID=2740835 RepID=A0A8X6GBL3_TRICU|nr:KH domain-containing, RNA-binding, signal transduction-associated protein 3 [Trichonephila clavata]
MTEYLKRKSLIQKKTELLYLVTDVVLPEAFDQDAPVRQKDDALPSSLNQSHFYSFSSENNPISIIQISVCNTEAAVCADTGATHSVAGEKLYHLLRKKGLHFKEKTIPMTLADSRTQTTEILTTSVDINIQGKVIPTELIVLKNARGNRTLLGIDFLTAVGIVLDLQRKYWYFTETPHRKYNFVKAPLNINALLTVDPEPHPCQLRENEVKVHIPIDEHPNFNFVGKLLGPKGNSLQQLQKATQTRMDILGRGSMRDKIMEEELWNQGNPKYAHLNEDLHVEVSAYAAPSEAYRRVSLAFVELQRFFAISSRTIHPSTRATTTRTNSSDSRLLTRTSSDP